MITIDDDHENNTKMYWIHAGNISDYPKYGWRSFGADACAHYQKLEDIYRMIDAASMQKLNILLLLVGCSHSFPLKFSSKP